MHGPVGNIIVHDFLVVFVHDVSVLVRVAWVHVIMRAARQVHRCVDFFVFFSFFPFSILVVHF